MYDWKSYIKDDVDYGLSELGDDIPCASTSANIEDHPRYKPTIQQYSLFFTTEKFQNDDNGLTLEEYGGIDKLANAIIKCVYHDSVEDQKLYKYPAELGKVEAVEDSVGHLNYNIYIIVKDRLTT